ncbi:MAG: 50S ribosomal protein L13 [Candidatus Gracilibacteria bacterium]|jgi:large subunit ribosomal protein L13|nr:50S ribosomal protein L13 [Candidatus Gracilibacteria bacterium]
MKTYLPKEADIKNNRKWYLVDAENTSPGRVATLCATLLRGKHKATFTPHLDTGDCVAIVNAEKIALKGNKLENKKYYTHSGKPGELKTKTAKVMLEQTPEKVLFLAIKGMLPNNKHKKDILKRLKIYAGAEHDQAAQKPEAIKIDAFSIKKS